MKRLIDIAIAAFGLLALSPFLLVLLVAIWLQDFCSPFYIASRVGRGGAPFRMVKLRSMVKNADRSGVSSTAGDDRRITIVGKFIRATKFDEVPQLWNVLRGDMSLVGPRPQVQSGVDLYTEAERKILDARPGITDLASIVFADEGEILRGSDDPDLRYNQVIRPYKSRLGLLYVEKRSVWTDAKIVVLTLLGAASRRSALNGVARILTTWGADQMLIDVARRQADLIPFPPPGATDVVAAHPA
jgi:lipopolysaccharide/colanic/teichoic acid biosynthesis glycosyltransferase